MKKFSLVLTVSLLLSVFLCNCASSQEKNTTVKLQIDNPVMTVNGIEREIDPGQGTTPVIVDDRTLVPIRAVIESFGGSADWDGETRTAILVMGDDTLKLTIYSTVAYYNDREEKLDVAPQIINDRTMLPVRFVAESLGLDVDWNRFTQTVTIVKTYNPLNDIPPYTTNAYTEINGNVPMFSETEISDKSYEYYSALDSLGRCGECIASIGPDIMPTGERERIGSVKPTGWHSVKYDNVDGKYLYNRCHLIGYQLTAENANEENLITGTRYMNTEGMLPFENMVADYIKKTGNNVMYRVTPIFDGNNLVASGVLMEGYSVQDNGKGISFCVYCYNVQPGICIDYSTGKSSFAVPVTNEGESETTYILNTSSKKFHFKSCSSVAKIKETNKSFTNKTRDELIADSYSPCGNCKP